MALASTVMEYPWCAQGVAVDYHGIAMSVYCIAMAGHASPTSIS